MFNANNEQLTDATNNTIDAANDFFQTSLQSIEKLTKIQLEASKKALEDASKTIKDLASATNSKDLFDKVNELATNTVENNICNCKDAYEILAETQSKLGKVFETYFYTAQQNVSNTVDNLAKFNPVKGNFAADSLKNFVNNTNQAIESFNKAASQVAEFANNNIKAAAATASTVKKAGSSSTKK
ncbi:MAG: phasin family protein [Neisseriaceae bacterium]